ncbi:hypothetical protein [Streptomyces sp. NPDC002133]|uniref:hypothetical protein n=1 Tax=Streptomyces sp. NPDC002133 TaxID=3154409 RepID=UPI00331CC99D
MRQFIAQPLHQGGIGIHAQYVPAAADQLGSERGPEASRPDHRDPEVADAEAGGSGCGVSPGRTAETVRAATRPAAQLGEKYSDRGDAEIFVDGASMRLVDTTATERPAQAAIFSVEGLSPGEHIVQIVKRSGKYATLDGFRVTYRTMAVVSYLVIVKDIKRLELEDIHDEARAAQPARPDPRPLGHRPRTAYWIKQTTGGNPNNIQQGYRLDGTVAESGSSVAFIAPFAVAAAADSGSQARLDALWNKLNATPLDPSGYYGASIELQVMTAITGYWLA